MKAEGGGTPASGRRPASPKLRSPQLRSPASSDRTERSPRRASSTPKASKASPVKGVPAAAAAAPLVAPAAASHREVMQTESSDAPTREIANRRDPTLFDPYKQEGVESLQTGALNILQIMVGSFGSPAQRDKPLRPPTPPPPVLLTGLTLEVARPYTSTMAPAERWLHASKIGHLEKLQELLGEDAQLLLAASHGVGNTALHWAASKGNLECVKWLLEAGTPVDVRNAGESTPLHSAAGAGKLPVVTELIERGADITLVDSAGLTADRLAFGRGAEDCAKLLASKRRQSVVEAGDIDVVDVAPGESPERNELDYETLVQSLTKQPSGGIPSRMPMRSKKRGTGGSGRLKGPPQHKTPPHQNGLHQRQASTTAQPLAHAKQRQKDKAHGTSPSPRTGMRTGGQSPAVSARKS